MFMHREFHIEIERNVDLEELSWPGCGEANEDSSLGGNLQYTDLRSMSWAEAQRVYDLEGELISRIERGEDPDEIEDELYEEPDHHLYGLDIGVASTVAAVSAAGCIPVSSCNAGAFGGSHHEWHPLVALYSRAATASLLMDCAGECGSGLINGQRGLLVAYANDIRLLREFAKSVLDRRSAFRAAARISTPKGSRGARRGRQRSLLD